MTAYKEPILGAHLQPVFRAVRHEHSTQDCLKAVTAIYSVSYHVHFEVVCSIQGCLSIALQSLLWILAG